MKKLPKYYLSNSYSKFHRDFRQEINQDLKIVEYNIRFLRYLVDFEEKIGMFKEESIKHNYLGILYQSKIDLRAAMMLVKMKKKY